MKAPTPSFEGLECQHMDMCVCALSRFSCVKLCDPMDCNPPVPLAMGFSRQEYTRVSFHALLPGIFPTRGSNPSPVAPALPADSLPLSHGGSPYKFGRGWKDANIQTFVLTARLT